MNETHNIAHLMKEAVAFNNKKQYKQALKLLHQALKLDPENQEILHQSGITYFSLDDLDKAVDCLLKSPDIDKGNYMIWYNIGNSYKMNKEYKKAINAFKIALTHNPNDTYKDMIAAHIDNLVLKIDYKK
ncbi:MAG: tetratricopeptide repeat protein [Candidatus Thorarchaeota archaeon]